MKNQRYEIPRKRSFRSNVIIDVDDWYILRILGHSGLETYTDLPTLKKHTNLSDKAIGLHLKRLKTHDFIDIRRSDKNFRAKIVILTKNGRKIVDALVNSPELLKVGKMFVDIPNDIINKMKKS